MSTHGKAALGPANHFYKHGMLRAPEYMPWKSMRDRCNNKKHPSYKRYGGRGITVCERWDDFASFYADMGARPTPEHTLERVNNDGNYEPGNCKWATRLEQQNNIRTNRVITFRGKTQTLTQWAREMGFSYCGLHSRLAKWSFERAMTQPPQKRRTSGGGNAQS